MGLDQLRKEILSSAHEKAQAIDSEASAKMRDIVRNAHMNSKKAEENAKAEGNSFVDGERNERLSAARLEARRMISEAKETAVNAALEKVWAAFARRRDSQAYRAALFRMAEKGVAELGSAHPRIAVNAADRKAMQNSKWKISPRILDAIGGVVVETPDGKIRVDCTLEEIFARTLEDLRKEIYARMFGGEEDNADAAPGKKGSGGKKSKAWGNRGKSAARKGKAAGKKGGMRKRGRKRLGKWLAKPGF